VPAIFKVNIFMYLYVPSAHYLQNAPYVTGIDFKILSRGVRVKLCLLSVSRSKRGNPHQNITIDTGKIYSPSLNAQTLGDNLSTKLHSTV
jgi:hypothetical protein